MNRDVRQAKEGKSQRRHKITAAALFGISLVYSFISFRLKMGTLRDPGPGLIPAVIGILLVACTVFYLVRVFAEAFREVKEEERAARAGKNYRAIAGILACTAAYPLILEPLKFILATFSSAFIMFFLLKPGKISFSFGLALVMAVGAFLIFSRLLGVALPSGFLENLLFRIGG